MICACGKDAGRGVVVIVHGAPELEVEEIVPCCGECDLSSYYPRLRAVMSEETWRELSSRPHFHGKLMLAREPK